MNASLSAPSLPSSESLSPAPRRSHRARLFGVVAVVAFASVSAFVVSSRVRAAEDARQAQLAALDHEARNAETEVDLALARAHAIDARLRELNATPVALPAPAVTAPAVHEVPRPARLVPARVVSRPTPPRVEIDPEAGPDPFAMDDIPSPRG